MKISSNSKTMSLGFVNAPKKFQQKQVVQSPPVEINLREQKQYQMNVRSRLSFLSVLSYVSFVSFLSFGSISSIASVGSVGSILSVGSSGSILSVGSNQCTLKLFTDCSVNLNTVATVTLQIDSTTFDAMATCTKKEYKSDDPPDHCDYQKATCRWQDNTQNVVMNCTLRRKGSSTWKEMVDKPSFKIKWDDKVTFASTSCGGYTVCPPDATQNVWKSKKITLNNNGYPPYYTKNGEVDAYDVFRMTGKSLVPSAQYVDVILKKDDHVMRTDTYAAIETINDKEFMKKWVGKNYGLWEIDAGLLEFKRDGGSIEVDNVTVPNLLRLSQEYMHTDDMINYYVGEVLTGHWDGACQSKFNNHYYSYDGQRWTIIPSGVDNTFQGCIYEISSRGRPTCLFMQECLNDDTCRYKVETRMAEVRHIVRRTTPTCIEELFPTLLILVMPTVAILVFVCAFKKLQNVREIGFKL